MLLESQTLVNKVWKRKKKNELAIQTRRIPKLVPFAKDGENQEGKKILELLSPFIHTFWEEE